MTIAEISAVRLQMHLDGPWRATRELTRAQLRHPIMHPVWGLEDAVYRARVFEQMQLLAATDIPRLLFPIEYGGLDDVGAAVTAFETLGTGDLSTLIKLGVHWGLFGGAVSHLGTKQHHDAYLHEIMDFSLPGCFAMTETGHGSDVQAIRTTATYDPVTDELIVDTPDDDARKDYIGNAAVHGRMAAVFAQLVMPDGEHGVHAVLVPIRTDDGPAEGVTITDCGHKAGLNGVDNGRIMFESVRVPRTALLDRFGSITPDGEYTSPIGSRSSRFFTMLGTLVKGRVSISGAALGATKTALTIAVRYGLTRRQFSAPDGDEVVLLDYQSHQRRLLPRLATTYALHAAQEGLTKRLDDATTAVNHPQEDQRKLESLAAGLKAITTWHASDTISECREACGGAGYLSENRLPQLRADCDVFTTFEGDNTVLMQLVAKGLLTAYRDDIGSLDRLSMVRYVADQFVETVIERFATRTLVQSLLDAVPRNDEDASLLDRGYQLQLLEWREKHVLESLARRMRHGMSADGDAFGVLNQVQDHLLLSARVHLERMVLEQAVDWIDRCGDQQTAAVLNLVVDLHAVSVLERDRAWFLEHGRFTPERAKATTATVNDLCGRVRPHVRSLVDAFAIGDDTIAAPIALGAEADRQRRRDEAA